MAETSRPRIRSTRVIYAEADLPVLAETSRCVSTFS